MSNRQRRERKKRHRHSRRVLLDVDERLGQLGHALTAGTLAVGLAAAPLAADLCADDPCVSPHRDHAVLLPQDYDVGPVPTRINVMPVIGPVASGGTILR